MRHSNEVFSALVVLSIFTNAQSIFITSLFGGDHSEVLYLPEDNSLALISFAAGANFLGQITIMGIPGFRD